MFNISWNILIAIFVVILVILYFRNCYEGFATNDEAIAAVASLYNTNNMTVGNFNASTANITGGSLKISGNPAENDKLIVNVNGTGDNADRYLYFNKSGILGVWSPSKQAGTWSIDPNGSTDFRGWTTTNGLTSNKELLGSHPNYPLYLGSGNKRFLYHIPNNEKNQLMLVPLDSSQNPLLANAFTLQNNGGVRVGGDKGFQLIRIGMANYTGPIVGPNKNTFSASEYVCIFAGGSAFFELGIKDGMWWVRALGQPAQERTVTATAMILCIPIKYFSYIYGGAKRDDYTEWNGFLQAVNDNGVWTTVRG